MSNAMKIIYSFTRIQERADIFKYHQEEIFAGLNMAEVHCIDQIGSLEYANVTKVANAMSMTRGAISKISKNLLDSKSNEKFLLQYRRSSVFCYQS